MVREFHRVIGQEARAQVLELTGRAARRGVRLRRRRVNAIGIFHDFIPTTLRSACSASRPAATASRPDGTPRRSPAERPACCTARSPTCCRTTRARRSSRTRSPRAWTTRASARSTPGSPTSGRADLPADHRHEAMDAFRLLCRTEGIIPAIESVARPRRRAARGPGTRPRRDRAGQPVRPRGQGRRHRREVVRSAHDGSVRLRAAYERAAQGEPCRTRRLSAGRLPEQAGLHRCADRDGRRRRATSSRSACRTATRCWTARRSRRPPTRRCATAPGSPTSSRPSRRSPPPAPRLW